jgi:hypothetical protein
MLAAWRGLYLSIDGLPQRLVLVGSIDDACGLASLAASTTGLLFVGKDVRVASLAGSLHRGAQWRSLAEFGQDLDWKERVNLMSALVNSLQPAALLVWGSEAGWEMLARHGGAIGRHTTLFATATDGRAAMLGDRSAAPLLPEVYSRLIGWA